MPILGEFLVLLVFFFLRVPSCLFFLTVFVIVTLGKGFVKCLDILECLFLLKSEAGPS